MLKESFVVATSAPEKPSHASKDLGIHLHEFQPLPALISSFKKSSAQANCLAVSASHIFAAQAEKAVLHVYSRDNGNQEAVVPFPERIHSIALAGDVDGAGVLALGTEGGRVVLWELGTGRQVSTPQSHLQATTCLKVDPTSNFLLSGSLDSNIHVWSIPLLLSFSTPSGSDPNRSLLFSPLRSLSNHRAAITALELGHSSSSTNIAVSASQDNTIIVWDYLNSIALHAYLLPSAPLCLALDPADRAVYAGYTDGSIQLIDFYKQPSITHTLHDPALQSTPTQPPPSDRWPSPGESPAMTLSLQVSYDGTLLLSGHKDGKVRKWDTAKGRYSSQLVDFSAPVTNLHMLPPTGFPNAKPQSLKLLKIVKPRYEGSLNSSGALSSNAVPSNYSLTARFTSTIPLPYTPNPSLFQASLSHPSFPPSLLEEGLLTFTTTQPQPANPAKTAPIPSMDGPTDTSTHDLSTLQTQNIHLLAQLDDALSLQRSAMAEVLKLEKERWERKEEDLRKEKVKKRRRLRRMKLEEERRRREMGEVVGNGAKDDRDDIGEGEGVSSSTGEISESASE